VTEQEGGARLSPLLRFVRTGSEVGLDEGGCSPTRARAGALACRRGSGWQQAERSGARAAVTERSLGAGDRDDRGVANAIASSGPSE